MNGQTDARQVPARRCPICRKPSLQDFRPFCSRRCADVDLGRWFGEAYSIPATEGPEDEDLDARSGPSNPE